MLTMFIALSAFPQSKILGEITSAETPTPDAAVYYVSARCGETRFEVRYTNMRGANRIDLITVNDLPQPDAVASLNVSLARGYIEDLKIVNCSGVRAAHSRWQVRFVDGRNAAGAEKFGTAWVELGDNFAKVDR